MNSASGGQLQRQQAFKITEVARIVNAMTRSRQWILAAVAVAAALIMPARAQDRDALTQWAKQHLVDKNVIIRHFYSGKELTYDASGNLTKPAKSGAPDIDGPIHIDDVKIKDDGIVIDATRQCGTWNGGLYETVRLTGKGMHIKIAAVPKTPADFAALVMAIFYGDRSQREADLEAYWQSFTDPLVPPINVPTGNVLKVGGNVKPPGLKLDPDPSYDEVARSAKLQGVVVVSVVVDESGHPRSMKFERHFGCGLDEKAVLAVSEWRFDPATRDGKPVLVRVNIQISFRLYR